MTENSSNGLASFVGLAASPLFLLLAAANFVMSIDNAGVAAPHAHMQDHSIMDPLASAIPSMWLMYALMALAHLPPWLRDGHRAVKQTKDDAR